MNRLKKILIMFLAVITVIGILPVQAEAAVKLNKTKATIYVGSSTTLKVSGTKSKAKWSTSNKKVATITSKGKVTAKKAGTATITAKVSGKKYTCKITVKNPYLNSTKKTLTVGKSYTLKIIGTTAKKWTSSNKNVATVTSKGKVTAKKAGTATITCTGKNGKSYKCKVTVTAKTTHTHSYISKVTKKATCTEEGVKTYACSCGDSYTEKIAKTAHSWDAGKVTYEATCSNYGTKTYTCTVCGEEKDEEIVPLAHTYTNTVKEPTCTEQGYTIYTCSACGYSYPDNYTGALGHDYEDVTMVEFDSSNCMEYENIYKVCRRCNYTELYSGHGSSKHNYITIEKEATCTEQGYTEYKCSVCGDSYKDNYVDALGHDKGSIAEVVDASKEARGYTVYKCSRCDDEFKDDYTDYNPTEEQVYNDIIALKEIYKEGDTWSEGDEYYRTWSGGIWGGADACLGFAMMLSEEAFGYLPARKHTDFSNIKVGDIISLYNNGHAAIVIEVTEDGGVYTAEGNVGAGTITWKSGYSYLDVEQYFNYVITRYPE